jgi:formate dehydrogenase accessory protein FdhD
VDAGRQRRVAGVGLSLDPAVSQQCSRARIDHGCADKVLFTTGRLTAEIVIKVAQSGIPIVVSRKGVTAICCELAANLGMTLFGHASRRRYICYAGVERFDAQV